MRDTYAAASCGPLPVTWTPSAVNQPGWEAEYPYQFAIVTSGYAPDATSDRSVALLAANVAAFEAWAGDVYPTSSR